MTKPEIELIEGEEDMSITLRGAVLAAYAERAEGHGTSIKQLIEGVLRAALADGRL